MASTPSTTLRLEIMSPGENDGTWGQKTNENFGILEAALTGTAAISTTGGTTTLTNVDYTNDQAKKLVLDVTGALVSNATIVIPNAAKSYKVLNRTTGSFTLTIKTSSGTGIVITQATGAEVYCDGSNTVRFLSPLVDFTTGAPATASGAAASAVSVTPTGNLSATTAQAALAELQGDVDTINATLLSSYQPLDSDLTTIGGLAKTDGNFIVGNGTNWVAESGNTARTSLGLGTGDSPTFSSLTAGGVSANQGGTMLFARPASGTTLNGPAAIQVYDDEMYFYEYASPFRGAYINLLEVAAGQTRILTAANGSLNGATGLPIDAGTTGTLPVARGGTGVTTSTGSGAVVLSSSPTLSAPALGTPASGTLTNCTGLPIVNGTTGTLSVARGGTGTTTSTGSGSVVLSASPTLTGSPIAPTQSAGTADTTIATTAFVWGTWGAPSGTFTTVHQTSAPLGWVKNTSYNDRALRLVNGTVTAGGSSGFTSVFTSRTIAEANLPSHTHSFSATTSSNGDHEHFVFADQAGTDADDQVTASDYARDSTSDSTRSQNYRITGTTTASATVGRSSVAGAHTHSVSGTTGGAGSGTAMDFAVAYIDLILIQKS